MTVTIAPKRQRKSARHTNRLRNENRLMTDKKDVRVPISAPAPLRSPLPSSKISIKSGPSALVAAALPPPENMVAPKQSRDDEESMNVSEGWYEKGLQAWKEAHEPHHKARNQGEGSWANAGKRAWLEEHNQQTKRRVQRNIRLTKARKASREAPIKAAEAQANADKQEARYRIESARTQALSAEATAKAQALESKARTATALAQARQQQQIARLFQSNVQHSRRRH